MSRKRRVLLIDDCREDMDDIEAFLGKGYLCTKALNEKEAFEHLETTPFQLVLLDIEFNGLDKGFEILSCITIEYPHLPVIMVTKYFDIDRIMKAVRLGAIHYVHKEEMAKTLLIAIEKALNEAALYRVSNLNEDTGGDKKDPVDRFIGASDAAKRIRAEVLKVASTDLPVLITGETGTGKDHLAKIIHDASPRCHYPFVQVICAEYAPEFINDELFGHVPGAFTGASRPRCGRLEEADRGTVFLNEVGEIDEQTQIKLLRAVEEGEFERLGSNKTISIDVRFIAATLKDVEKLIEEGRFRKDLYYRLFAHRIHIPPLRERREDIPALIDFFIRDAARRAGKSIPRIRPEVLETLIEYDWPGNVRELKVSIDRAVQTSNGGTLRLQDIIVRPLKSYSELPYREAKDQFKKIYILDLLERYDWKVQKVAKHSGLAREYIYSLLKKWGISPDAKQNRPEGS